MHLIVFLNAEFTPQSAGIRNFLAVIFSECRLSIPFQRRIYNPGLCMKSNHSMIIYRMLGVLRFEAQGIYDPVIPRCSLIDEQTLDPDLHFNDFKSN